MYARFSFFFDQGIRVVKQSLGCLWGCGEASLFATRVIRFKIVILVSGVKLDADLPGD